jgi:ATP adenylyltransferase
MTAARGDTTDLQPEGLRAAVQAASGRARASGALVPLDTRVRLVPDAGITFLVRVSANVARKQAAGASGGRDEDQPPADPFAPPYEPDLYVGELSATHVALLNKFNVLDEHLLIVTREWAPQTQMLDTADCEALLLGLAGIDGLAFYNGGTEAGASQPHKHLQIVPLPLAREGPSLPIAPLLERASFRHEVGTIADLPFRHAVARLQPAWIAAPGDHARDLAALIASLWRALGCDPRGEEQPLPYNLLATRQWLWLVPRGVEAPRGVGINALGYAGALLAPDEQTFGTLCNAGPMQLLGEAGG